MDVKIAVQFLKLLADETRLKLVGLLAQRERSVGELAEILGLKEPTISHHLSRLAKSGLVRMRRDGTTHFYRLHVDKLNELSREFFSAEQVNALAEEAGGDAWEAKVLRTYFEEGRLTRIPAMRKKRDVILRWLADQFESGTRYPEREVNDLIGQYHPDFATLRRELIMGRLMERDAGVYWRTEDAA